MSTPVTNIGAELKVARAFNPADSAAATITGTGVDRLGYDSMVLHVNNGAASGAPDSYTVDAKVQDSADNSTFADISGATITQITADNTDRSKSLNLRTAARYVRVVCTVAFTGGTSPKVEVAGAIILGGASVLPAA